MYIKTIKKPASSYPHRSVFAFSCVRNEILRIEWFLEYHRALGIDAFFIVDNNSSDGTLDFLADQKDVYLFWTDDSYAESHCGVDWINYLLLEHAINHWALILDADELFAYPLCEKISLPQLAGYLDSAGADAVNAVMLDMYSDNPINKTHYNPGAPFIETCPYFDSDTYDFLPPHGNLQSSVYRGGPRARAFWNRRKRDLPPPYLRKFPLVKWRKDLAFEASTHIINNVSTADISSLILHFKFFSDFGGRIAEEVERQEHWNDASQYKAYLEVSSEAPDLCLLYDGSARYAGSSQMLSLGFMSASDSFYEYFGTRHGISRKSTG